MDHYNPTEDAMIAALDIRSPRERPKRGRRQAAPRPKRLLQQREGEPPTTPEEPSRASS